MSSSPPPGPPPPPGPERVPPPGVGPAPLPALRPSPSTAPNRGPSVALFVVLALLLGAIAVAGVLLLRATPSVAGLETGDCLVGADLAAGAADIAEFEVTGCEEVHDVEVLAVTELSASDAENYTGERGAQACAATVAATPQLAERGMEVRPLTEDDDLGAGDRLVCVARAADGEPTTDSVGR